ncbi:hypothetical protein F8O01_03370 [Pseudoclavibacter chungangensis]|uniref:NlpC/P60 domain-containing protein n=1 Tax=Pseudoclavibacter chungangensis TaxID=587635 RepID=A0A7J5C1R8_9MICO|nr:NlpC/P60 family protein [Pseudoclavibacter chungangensis]KAB1660375.1 hypothetical protein F8O01_03370 [Pseudoclavibacter chungangensis]NYJ65737.1 cell wall-associated NlpC family hydrolase [Pseudoclavibacter chungangensis]
MDTTTIAPLTRREAREIERRTGRRPVAGAVAPTELTLTTALDVAHTDVEDTSRIERNEMAALVSVVPTEIIERIAAPSPVESLVDAETEIPDAFRGRPVSVRAAKPASLVARQRRRRATGLAIAASAAALATAGAIIPASLGSASNEAHSANLLEQANVAAAGTSTAPDDAAADAAAPVVDLVPAPEQVDGSDPFSVTTFSADEVSEAAEVKGTTDGGVSTGGSTGSDTQGAGGGGYGSGYGEGVINTAASMLGQNAGWTCDRFVREVFAANGISVGVGVSAIAAQGYQVSASEARAGDLVVWPGEHIGIYDGAGGVYDNPGDGRPNAHRAIWSSNVIYIRL